MGGYILFNIRPVFLKSGQIVTGISKVFVCTGDGEVREFNKGGGGVPVYGKDFTYTGEYLLIDDTSDEEDIKWRIKFLSSGNFTPLTDMVIDAFFVGGGGGGCDGGIYANASVGGFGGGGGGGGYTKTEKSIVLSSNIEYPIIIGDGGTIKTKGGTSSGFNISTDGGMYGGLDSARNGGDGGSGGGTGANCTKSGDSFYSALAGGCDGSDGTKTAYSVPGKGQGTTTREFGESTGDLYAGGGGGGATPRYSTLANDDGGAGGGGGGGHGGHTLTGPTNGEQNSGGGGGGGTSKRNASGIDYPAANGGSGIVIIRNHRE